METAPPLRKQSLGLWLELLIAKCFVVGNGVEYTMTLLTFCGFHGQKDMVELLLGKGAGIRILSSHAYIVHSDSCLHIVSNDIQGFI